MKKKRISVHFGNVLPLRIILGVSAIGISYIIGWPAVAFLGTLSIYFQEPLIVAIGGPVTYGLSHLVFLLGMYLAGAKYTRIFLRWAARALVEKFSKVNAGVEGVRGRRDFSRPTQETSWGMA